MSGLENFRLFDGFREKNTFSESVARKIEEHGAELQF